MGLIKKKKKKTRKVSYHIIFDLAIISLRIRLAPPHISKSSLYYYYLRTVARFKIIVLRYFFLKKI